MHSCAFQRLEHGCPFCFMYLAMANSICSVFSKFALFANSIKLFLVTSIVPFALPLLSK